MRPGQPLANLRWVPFICTYADVPAYAVMQVTGATSPGGKTVLSTKQPDGSGTLFAINGPVAVKTNACGRCVLAVEWPACALYESSDGTPACGETWGPKASSWTLHKGLGGFLVIQSQSNYRVSVLRMETGPRLIKVDNTYSGHAAVSASATFSGQFKAALAGGSSPCAVDEEVASITNYSTAIPDNATGIICAWDPTLLTSGGWLVIDAPCA